MIILMPSTIARCDRFALEHLLHCTVQHYAGVAVAKAQAKFKKKVKRMVKNLVTSSDTNEDGNLSFDEVKTSQLQDPLLIVDCSFVPLSIQVKANIDVFTNAQSEIMGDLMMMSHM